MPYLQLDVNQKYPVELKKRLVQEMSTTYANMMTVDIRRISIAIRELGEGCIWRIVDGEPVPVSVLMCDIRRGRTPELRMEVAKVLCNLCTEILSFKSKIDLELKGDLTKVFSDAKNLLPTVILKWSEGVARYVRIILRVPLALIWCANFSEFLFYALVW